MDEIEKLIGLLKSEDVTARINAAERLGKIKDKRAVPGLIKALKDKEWRVRRNAVQALGGIGDISAVSALIKTLKDKDDTRGEAASALGRIGDASTVSALIKLLKDKDEWVRYGVIYTLEDIVGKCETIEELEKVEKGIEEGSVALRKGRADENILIGAQIKVAELTRETAKRKDELAPKRDLLLDDKPKVPKKGRGVYHALRMATPKGNIRRG